MKPAQYDLEYADRINKMYDKPQWKEDVNSLLACFPKLERGDIIIDFGCSTGRLSKILAEKLGAFVVGLDISKEAIDYANAYNVHQKVSYVWDTSSAEAYRYKLGAHVLLHHVLAHQKDTEMLLKRLVARLKPTTITIVTQNPRFSWWMKPWNWLTKYQSDPTVKHDLPAHYLKKLGEVLGAEVQVHYYGEQVKYLPFLWTKSTRARLCVVMRFKQNADH